MDYNRNTNRQIVNHTINPRWTTRKAYKSHLNSPVTVTRADGTVVVEKPLNTDEINTINKIPKKRKRNKRKAKFVHVNEVIKQEIAREHAIKDREISHKEFLARQKAQQPKPVEVQPIVVLSTKPVAKRAVKPAVLPNKTEFKAVRQPDPAWLARKAEQEAANAQRTNKSLPWEGRHDYGNKSRPKR